MLRVWPPQKVHTMRGRSRNAAVQFIHNSPGLHWCQNYKNYNYMKTEKPQGKTQQLQHIIVRKLHLWPSCEVSLQFLDLLSSFPLDIKNFSTPISIWPAYTTHTPALNVVKQLTLKRNRTLVNIKNLKYCTFQIEINSF